MTTAAEWWAALTPGTRARLRADPRGIVPAELVGEVGRGIRLIPVASWPPEGAPIPGPAYHLPGDLAEYIRDVPDAD